MPRRIHYLETAIVAIPQRELSALGQVVDSWLDRHRPIFDRQYRKLHSARIPVASSRKAQCHYLLLGSVNAAVVRSPATATQVVIPFYMSLLPIKSFSERPEQNE